MKRQSRWLCGLKCGFVAAGLLEFLVRILPGIGMSVSWECCVFSGVSECELGTSTMRRPRPNESVEP